MKSNMIYLIFTALRSSFFCGLFLLGLSIPQNVELYISDINMEDEYIEISINSDVSIYGYQFYLSNMDIQYGEALLGIIQGYFVSIGQDGLILGYGFPETPIEPTNAPLCRLYFAPSSDSVTCIQDPLVAGYFIPIEPSTGDCWYVDYLPPINPGDMNQDLQINISDIIIIINVILGNSELSLEYLYIGDINDDNTLNIIDIVLLINQIIME